MSLEAQHIANKPVVSDDNGYMFYIRPCVLRMGRLVASDEVVVMSLLEAANKFAPSMDAVARANILKARRGHFIGLQRKGAHLKNFLIINPTTDGDIRWLLRKVPELEMAIQEVYLVDEVSIPYNAIDLPSIGGGEAR